MKKKLIPFNRPALFPETSDHLRTALMSSRISGDGLFSEKCHQFLEENLGVQKALLTTSCTHALEMCAILLDIQPGDEVIVPSFTFVSTVNAFVLRGAKPIFIDSRLDTLNLDENQLESKINSKTKAIVVVHYAGISCEMETILEIARRHHIVVIEDAAHALFGQYQGKPLGSIGALATLSFHETKNFSCGEGGALLINDPQLIERAKIIRDKGTNRGHYFRGLVDKYTWVDLGSSYLMSDILAAVLWSQLEQYEKIQLRRKQLWEAYQEGLRDWARQNTVVLPIIPSNCISAYHMFYLMMPDSLSCQRLIEHLKDRGVSAVFHYVPLHLSEMGKKLTGMQPEDCPVAKSSADKLLRLPFFYDLSNEDQEWAMEAIMEFKT